MTTRLLLRTILTVLAAAGFAGAKAQNHQLHTVFMYSFARYIQWPEEAADGDFSIQVLGDSPIVDELHTLATRKKIGDRAIQVTKVNSIGELTKCNILFVPASKSGVLPEILSKLGDSSTLIVTEQAGLAAKGSNINFIQKDGKLLFELNPNAFSKRKLRPSTELTRMAILI